MNKLNKLLLSLLLVGPAFSHNHNDAAIKAIEQAQSSQSPQDQIKAFKALLGVSLKDRSKESLKELRNELAPVVARGTGMLTLIRATGVSVDQNVIEIVSLLTQLLEKVDAEIAKRK